MSSTRKTAGVVEKELLPGFPKVSGQDGNETISVSYTVSAEYLENHLPLFGDLFSEYQYPFFIRYTDFRLTGRNVDPYPGGELYTLALTYSSNDGAIDGGDRMVMREVERDTVDQLIPLEKLPKYRTNWNYCLAINKSKVYSPALYTWWGEAKNTVIPNEYADIAEWVKPGDSPRNGFVVSKAETKPGVTGKQWGVCVVHLTERSTSLELLNKSAELDYTPQIPPETFGRPGAWLRGGSKITKDGKYWVLRVDFINSETIDKDMY